MDGFRMDQAAELVKYCDRVVVKDYARRLVLDLDHYGSGQRQAFAGLDVQNVEQFSVFSSHVGISRRGES